MKRTHRTASHSTSRPPTPASVPATGSVISSKPLTHMNDEEARSYLIGLRDALQRKQARERAYLERRAARGTHTPTDEAYEQDQLLEEHIPALFTHLLTELDAREQDDVLPQFHKQEDL